MGRALSQSVPFISLPQLKLSPAQRRGFFLAVGSLRLSGQSQQWETLDNLGAVKSDAAGIAYAIERDWLVLSGGLHSVSLTEVGRQRLKAARTR